jgi:signal transduction histidine kinase
MEPIAQELIRLREERDALRAELERRAAEVDELRIELDETNRGVVALYAELDDKAVALREVSDLKTRFLSYMSHEFRTPLGAIRSLTRLLLDRMDGPLTPEQEKQLTFVQNSALELSEMVDDLLDLAKIEAGRISISPGWFDLIDLFAALRGMFKPIATNNTVSLIFEEPVEIPRIYSDDKRLSQILRNFISNGLKFTANGEVRVTARFQSPGWVTFAVSDTGIGIAPEHLGGLFQDFVQLDSPVQKRWRGTGLGLSLSKRLAELLGGRVDVQSEVGRGSTFSVTIPNQLTVDVHPEIDAHPVDAHPEVDAHPAAGEAAQERSNER